MNGKKLWYQQKTTWVGIVAVVGALGSVITGELTLVAGLQIIVPAVLAIFLRQGVENSK